MKYDVVYVLKNGIQDDELIYSVRSVVKNFPYNKIWFYGGVPEHVVPDEQVSYDQLGYTKYERTRRTWREICQNEKITDSFWLFNDDFFVMDRVADMSPVCQGTLYQHVKRLERKNRGPSKYSTRLVRTMRLLKDNNYDILDYELHIPMLINKSKGLSILNRYTYDGAFRSLYGNMYYNHSKIEPDVKIISIAEEPDPDKHNTFISTSDESFKHGYVGQYIRRKFPEKSKYEKEFQNGEVISTSSY